MKTFCRRVAIVLGISGALGSYALGSTFGSFSISGSTEFNYWVFLGGIISVGCFVVLFLALGEILENQEKMIDLIMKKVPEVPLSEKLVVPALTKERETVPSSPSKVAPVSLNATQNQGISAPSDSRVAYRKTGKRSGEIACSICDTSQRADRKFCWECGAEFVDE